MVKTGYEKVAHLMSTHPETAIFKRFGFLDASNTLYLQAELIYLERELKRYLARRFRAETEQSSLMRNESVTEMECRIVFRQEEQNDVGESTMRTQPLEIRTSLKRRILTLK